MASQQPARRSRGRSKLWPEGLHIAPYLSPNGRFVLVALGRRSWFVVAAEVTSLAGSRQDGGDEPSSRCSARVLEPSTNHAGMIPFISPYCAGLRGRSLDALLWSRGVHAAPWRCCLTHAGKVLTGRPLIAVDAQRRLVAEMLVPDGEDPAAVRRDLLAVLEATEADPDAQAETTPATSPITAIDDGVQGYHDPYDDGNEDDDDEPICGEGWSRR